MNQNSHTVPAPAIFSANESALLRILEKLITFRTSGGNEATQTESACLNYVEQLLKCHGACHVERLHDTSGSHEHLIAILNSGQMNGINNGLLLCGHLDVVVGAEEQFTPRRKNGRLYGRGAVDMKGSIACFLHLLPLFVTLPYPVLFAFTMDEENEMQGIRAVCDWLTAHNIHPTLTLLGEPTGNKLGIASCGIEGFRSEFYGKAVHSSRPQEGTNALYMAARMLTRLEELSHAFLEKRIYINVGSLNGGGNPATVPDRATLHWGYRSFSPECEAELQQACEQTEQQSLQQGHFPGGRIETHHEWHFPAFHATDDKLTAQLCDALGCEAAEIPYTTEAGYLQQVGQRVYLLGAGQPSEAHTADESISAAELTDYTQKLLRLCLLLAEKQL